MNKVENPNLRPPFTIFLDIYGVLYNTVDQGKIIRKSKELFPAEKEYYSTKCTSIATTYFFDQNAVKNLMMVIEEIRKYMPVQIVISSTWRALSSVEELQTTFLRIHPFSKYITDKTAINLHKEEIQKFCSHEYHINGYSSLCRGAEIRHWLSSHPKITHFAILDDNDDHLSYNFGDNFFKVDHRELLNSTIVDQILRYLQKFL